MEPESEVSGMRVLGPSTSLDAYRSFTRWAYVAVVLLFGLTGIAASALVSEPTAWGIAAAGTVTALACVSAWYWPRKAPSGVLELAALLAAAGWVSVIWNGTSPVVSFALFLPLAYGIATRRPWWPWVTGSVLVLLLAVFTATIGGRLSEDRWLPGLVVAVFFLCGQIIVLLAVEVGWVLFARMDAYRANENELSIAQERLRFANELHDVQGHTLLAIKLKAELARRSLDRAPEVARAELTEIERLVSEASVQTRQIANGYRAVPLAAELANVERLLTAAGISARIDAPPSDMGEWEPLFGAVAREGVSNILRHAEATSVSISFTPDALTIINDGARGDAPDTDGGNGLPSLRERFKGHHGSVTWERDGQTFALVATRSSRGTRP